MHNFNNLFIFLKIMNETIFKICLVVCIVFVMGLVVYFLKLFVRNLIKLINDIFNFFDYGNKNTSSHVNFIPIKSDVTNTYKNTGSYVNTSPKENDAMKIILIETLSECREACKKIRNDCLVLSALGFDCEWVSYHLRNPVALLQLATYKKDCYLFRLNKLSIIPFELIEILEDRHIFKLGVLPATDGLYLTADYDIEVIYVEPLKIILQSLLINLF